MPENTFYIFSSCLCIIFLVLNDLVAVGQVIYSHAYHKFSLFQLDHRLCLSIVHACVGHLV